MFVFDDKDNYRINLKEIKNSIDNENIIKIEDRKIIREFIDKIRKELNYQL